MQPHQLLIQAEWRGPRRHAEHGIRLGIEHFHDDLRRGLAHLLVVSLNDDFHGEPPAGFSGPQSTRLEYATRCRNSASQRFAWG